MNSGLRVFRRDIALRYLKILPDGFSFTTTITICFLRNRRDAYSNQLFQTDRQKPHQTDQRHAEIRAIDRQNRNVFCSNAIVDAGVPFVRRTVWHKRFV